MKLFKKFTRICIFLFSFLMLFPSFTLAEKFCVTSEGAGVYRVSAERREPESVIELEGEWDDYFLKRACAGQYIVYKRRLCSDQPVCGVFSMSPDKYLLQFKGESLGGWNLWSISKSADGLRWVLEPFEKRDPFKRKVCMNKIFGGDSWCIESECHIDEEAIVKNLAVVHFDPGLNGEMTDIMSFLAAIVNYPEFERFL